MLTRDPWTTLVVTNDFPPRIGGIESFVAQVCELLDHRVVVLTSTSPGAASHDETLPYPVVRAPTSMLLPTPAAARAATELLRQCGGTRVLFGAAAPLGLLARPLRRVGARRILALTHGHERWWAALPGTRSALARIGDDVDAMSTIADAVAERLAPALSPAARDKLVRIAPPVDLELFAPGPVSDDRRRCIAVGRFVPRKGLVTLLAAWRQVQADPATRGSELVLVGDGPQRSYLHTLVRRWSLTGTVRFTGPLDRRSVADELRRAHVYAFPVRDRWGGLDAEGLGLATLEAAAAGLPVVVGRSGGAPETVRDGITGQLIDGRDPTALAAAVGGLLADPDRARRWGLAGRAYVARTYGADRVRAEVRHALDLPTASGDG